MEKQRINRKSRFIKRLLISFSIFTFFGFNLYSQELTLEDLQQLKFKPIENQKFFKDSDIQYEVIIPGIAPEDIQVVHEKKNLINENVSNSEELSDIVFKSMKKFQDYETGGTKIQTWFKFENTGTFTPAPIKLSANNISFFLHFDEITITEDPASMAPRIVVIFSNGTRINSDDLFTEEPIFTATTGKKLYFTVYLQYATQLVEFDFDIPQDSIYQQTKTYEITEVKYREKSISDKLIPVADFQWTGLSSGIIQLPKFKLTAIGYNGYRTNLILPAFKINFIKNTSASQSSEENHMFDDSFAEPFSDIPKQEKIVITEEDCKKLAELHQKERNSFFNYFKAKKERIAFEEKLGIPITDIGPNVGSIVALIALIIIFTFILIIFIKKGKIFREVIFAILIFISVLLLIFTAGKRSHQYGICKGCTIYSIPEKEAEAFFEIAPGYIVDVTENTNNWYHVQLGETSGWCTTENIIVIK